MYTVGDQQDPSGCYEMQGCNTIVVGAGLSLQFVKPDVRDRESEADLVELEPKFVPQVNSNLINKIKRIKMAIESSI